MLAEINERDASGEIARTFEEIRHLWGVPYVSAIHRHLATRPGVLEWAWEAVAPAFRDGRAQTAGWAAADGATIPPLDPISRDALVLWGLDDTAIETVKAVAEGFVRVAPVNMMFAGLVKALIEGKAPVEERAAGRREKPAFTDRWSPPVPLPIPPAMVALDTLDPALRGVLLQFASTADGKPFVPGLYRMIAHWPDMLAHLATVLVPRLASPDMSAACDRLRSRIDAAVPGVLAGLATTQTAYPKPNATECAHFLEIGGVYRKTSPEMVVLGRLIGDAMPSSP